MDCTIDTSYDLNEALDFNIRSSGVGLKDSYIGIMAVALKQDAIIRTLIDKVETLEYQVDKLQEFVNFERSIGEDDK